MVRQEGLFAELEGTFRVPMPEGFRYQEDIMSEAEEAALVASLASIDHSH